MEGARTHYEVLGVSNTAEFDKIKTQFRKLVIQYHPDKVRGKEAEFRLVHKAWEVLRDTELRQQYDQRLQDEAIVANTASSNHLEIDLDDMEYHESKASFSSACYRCGGEFQISEQQLDEGDADIECSGCSLRATVMYDIASDEDSVEALSDGHANEQD